MAGVGDLPLPVLSELASVALAAALSGSWQPLGPYSASTQIIAGSGRLCGITLRATTATVAAVRLWDGDGNNGQLILDVDASQGFAIMGGPSDPGVQFRSGLYAEVLTGTPSLCVWVRNDQ